MSQKIKSVNIFPNGAKADFSEKEIEFMQNYSNIFKLEYEKPKLLKRADGSLISEPLEGTEILIIEPALKFNDPDFKTNYFFVGSLWSKESEVSDLSERFFRGWVFLREDEQLVEKKAKMLTKQLEIQFEIDRLNAEEGWVELWNCNQRNYFLNKFSVDSKDVEIKYYFVGKQHGTQYMSYKTATTILAKYSEDELKQYLGIII